MMQGKMREYSWQDVLKLLYADIGLKTEEEIRQRGEVHYVGKFQEPDHLKDTSIRITSYDEVWDKRIDERNNSTL